jgi:hypothetical protein
MSDTRISINTGSDSVAGGVYDRKSAEAAAKSAVKLLTKAQPTAGVLLYRIVSDSSNLDLPHEEIFHRVAKRAGLYIKKGVAPHRKGFEHRWELAQRLASDGVHQPHRELKVAS